MVTIRLRRIQNPAYRSARPSLLLIPPYWKEPFTVVRGLTTAEIEFFIRVLDSSGVLGIAHFEEHPATRPFPAVREEEGIGIAPDSGRLRPARPPV